MERWAKARTPPPSRPRPRRYVDQPSFSSTLLDAIYKSMDEPNPTARTAIATEATATDKKQHDALQYYYYYKPSLAASNRERAAAPHATTSSSSDCSSYGGFSSSEAESSHRSLRPIRTSVPGAPAPPPPEKKAKKPGASIRGKLRDLRKPASPGARLASFLNSIFSGKRPPPSPAAAAASAESACSTATSYSRSCLSKTPSTRGQAKRTVRFLDNDGEVAAPTVADRRTFPAVSVEEMLLRRMDMESDDDEDDEESSDASSDLFDLENFADIAPASGGGGPGAYRDELPVYETTRVELNRVIGHGHGYGYAHGHSSRII